MSVTVIVLWTVVVGVVKANDALFEAEPVGVEYLLLSQVTVAVFLVLVPSDVQE